MTTRVTSEPQTYRCPSCGTVFVLALVSVEGSRIIMEDELECPMKFNFGCSASQLENVT